jgi:hypothetical protein
MKFVVLGYYDPIKFDSMPEAERNNLFDACLTYDDDVLRKGGHFAGGEALELPHTARTVQSKNGKVVVLDGPYTETKEVLGGILILEARDLDHAIELMSKHPAVNAGNVFDIRAVSDMTEISRASKRRRGATE